jgi:hypothetical protein
VAITAVTTLNPIKVTGAPTSATEKVTDSDVLIQKIVWSGATTNTHACTIYDKDGNTLWTCNMVTSALGQNMEADFPMGLYAHGIYVYKNDSGMILIYLK